MTKRMLPRGTLERVARECEVHRVTVSRELRTIREQAAAINPRVRVVLQRELANVSPFWRARFAT